MDENYKKLGQIVKVLKNEDYPEATKISKIKLIIDGNFEINYQLPFSSLVCQDKPEYSGNTALHFAVLYQPLKTPLMNLLIEQGADFMIRNDNGYTPLLLGFSNNLVIDFLLFAHLKSNSVGVNCKSEVFHISHFHVACCTVHVTVIDFFLNKGVSINDRINDNSPKYAGYTPLHFAVQYNQLQTVEWLLNKGGKINCKDTNGITPLHMLIKKCIKSHRHCEFLLRIESLIPLPDHVGLTRIHINFIADAKNKSLVKKLLNKNTNLNSSIRFDSPIWPGCTPLHVAANFNFKTVILLLEQGANLLAQDASGTTPLDLCMEKYKLHQVIQILSAERCYQLAQIKLTDGTKLLDILQAMKSINEFEQFLENKIMNVNIFIPFDSIIWPGDNLLHLALRFNVSIESLLSQNVNFTMLNKDNMSPLHLAYRLNVKNAVTYILNYHDRIPINCVDRENLSHLYIACAARDSKAVKILLQNTLDPNLPTLKDIHCPFSGRIMKTGSTPFHMSIRWIDYGILNEFLTVKGNFNAIDANNVTPFEVLFDLIFSENNCNKGKLVQMLNKILTANTKVQFTNKMSFKMLNKILIDTYGINKICTKLIDLFIHEKLYEKLGLSRLQVACALGKFSMIAKELKSGVDINQQVAFDSVIWPGDTALHACFQRKKFPPGILRIEVVKLLLENGANPNLKNAKNLTFIHLIENEEIEAVTFLMNKQFITINPVNNDGLSHFHLCCKTKNLILIEKFLESGVNVNTAVDYFAEHCAGYTPLYFAIQYGSKEVVELLLKYGADPNIQNSNGLFPLDLAISMNENGIIKTKTLLSCTALDIEAMNSFNETIFESIFYNPQQREKYMNLLLNKSSIVKLARLSQDIPKKLKLIKEAIWELHFKNFLLLINSLCNVTDIDHKGQNALYHIFDNNKYIYQSTTNKIELLIISGCELNHKDNEGQTVLHTCTNPEAIHLYLSLGADINIKNDQGNTPYQPKYCYSSELQKIFEDHIIKLELAGLFVEDCNKIIYEKAKYETLLNDIVEEKCQLDTKFKEMGYLSFNINYFYSEKFIANYRQIKAFQRNIIQNICDSIDLQHHYPITHTLIILQFRKARARTRLLEPATIAFQLQAGLVLPELCLEAILKYLSNSDLMNLIRAENNKLVFASLPENC